MRLQAHSVLEGLCGGKQQTETFLSGGVAVSEREDKGCVLCTAAVNAKQIAGELSKALELDVPLEPGVVSAAGERAVSWVSPRSWLVHMPVANENDVIIAVAGAFPNRHVHASRYSDQLCWLEIKGKGAEALLKQGGFVSLECGGFRIGNLKRTRIADISMFVWRQVADVWLLGIERCNARYFLDWLRVCDDNRFAGSDH